MAKKYTSKPVKQSGPFRKILESISSGRLRKIKKEAAVKKSADPWKSETSSEEAYDRLAKVFKSQYDLFLFENMGKLEGIKKKLGIGVIKESSIRLFIDGLLERDAVRLGQSEKGFQSILSRRVSGHTDLLRDLSTHVLMEKYFWLYKGKYRVQHKKDVPIDVQNKTRHLVREICSYFYDDLFGLFEQGGVQRPEKISIGVKLMSELKDLVREDFPYFEFIMNLSKDMKVLALHFGKKSVKESEGEKIFRFSISEKRQQLEKLFLYS